MCQAYILSVLHPVDAASCTEVIAGPSKKTFETAEQLPTWLHVCGVRDDLTKEILGGKTPLRGPEKEMEGNVELITSKVIKIAPGVAGIPCQDALPKVNLFT